MDCHQQPYGLPPTALWAEGNNLSRLPPTVLWAAQVSYHLSAYGLLGSSLRGCHKAFQGGCGLYVGLPREPKDIINYLFFSFILLGDLHNFIN